MERTLTTTKNEKTLRPQAAGRLAGSLWSGRADLPPVVAVHGITANHRSFVQLTERVDATVLAVDLRGRGASRDLPAPYGLEQHADDVAATMTVAGLRGALVVGHSMGAFVAVRLAQRHPELVGGLLLVDGGLPVRPVPPDIDPEVFLGPAIERLSLTFGSVGDYREFWKQHPAIGPYWSPAIEEYVDYDLVEVEGALRPSAVADAVRTDLLQLDGRDGYTEALHAVVESGVPLVLLESRRGLFDEEGGLYEDAWLARWTEELPLLEVRNVPETNHYTILMGAGAPAVAEVAEELLGRIRQPGS